MRTFLLGLITGFLLVAATTKGQINTVPLDKITHFCAGYAISYTAYHIFEDKKKAFTIALLTGVTAGLAKEGLDAIRGKPFSMQDVYATSFGALLGTVTFKVVLNFKQRKKGDMSAFENIGPVKEGLFDKPLNDDPCK